MEFHEYLVRRKFGTAEKALRVMLYVAAFFFMLCCNFYLRKLGWIGGIPAVGGWFLAYFLASRLKKEFEYTCVEDRVDIDIIYNGSKRKNLISFSVENVEVLASMKDENFRDYRKGNFDKIVDATTWEEGANVYFAIFEQDGRTIVKFEPPIACLKYLKQFAPRNVHIDMRADDEEEFE